MRKIKLKQYIVFVLSVCFILNINIYANGKTVQNTVVPVMKINAVYVTKIASINNIKKDNKGNKAINLKSNTNEITKLDTVTTKNAQSTSTTKIVENIKFEQLNRPVKGEEIAVIKTKLGVIKIKLLTNYAPKAVEIFKNRVNNGFYNDLSFNKLIGNSIVQGGTSGNTMQNSEISTNVNYNLDAYNPEVRNFRGAVSIASGDSGSIDQFVIVQAGPAKIIKDTLNYMKSSGDKLFPKQVITKYQKIGGAPWLDYHNVIFGQVFSGIEIVDKMSRSAVNENNSIKKEIKIVKITIETFK